jgi:hypothetical protein
MIILIINIIKYIITISYSLNFVEPADTLVKQPETCYSSKSAYQKFHHKHFHYLLFILFVIILPNHHSWCSAKSAAKCVPENVCL